MKLVNIRTSGCGDPKSYIYIITDPDRRNKMQHDLYKLGIWSGTYKCPIRRYITYLPQVRISLFQETEHGRHIELLIKRLFIDNRQININGRYSEWFKGCINLIIPFIFDKINEIKIIGTGESEPSIKFESQLDKLTAWNEAPIILEKNYKHIKVTCPRKRPLISYMKSKLLYYIESQYRDSISDEQLYDVKDHIVRMDNLYYELNFTDQHAVALLQLDINEIKDSKKRQWSGKEKEGKEVLNLYFFYLDSEKIFRFY